MVSRCNIARNIANNVAEDRFLLKQHCAQQLVSYDMDRKIARIDARTVCPYVAFAKQ